MYTEETTLTQDSFYGHDRNVMFRSQLRTRMSSDWIVVKHLTDKRDVSTTDQMLVLLSVFMYRIHQWYFQKVEFLKVLLSHLQLLYRNRIFFFFFLEQLRQYVVCNDVASFKFEHTGVLSVSTSCSLALIWGTVFFSDIPRCQNQISLRKRASGPWKKNLGHTCGVHPKKKS